MDVYGVTPQCLTKNGKPWFPVMGEIHFSRVPRERWKETVLRMKAGGIDIVSCYVLWIHHEEEEGRIDFTSGKDLRGFLNIVKETGLKVILRIGPWAHGECRNGGFPDWLLEKQIDLRSDDASYLCYANRWYQAIAGEVKGLLEQDGGPVIGIQLENEYGHVGGQWGEAGEQHMRTLWKLAENAGMTPPLFTATGWGGAVTGGAVPVMGGYCDAPWDPRITEIEPSGNFVFTPERNDHNIGSDHGFGYGITYDIERFPYLTAELGGGLQVTHHRRTVAASKDVGAMSLCKMGSGCTLLGYYMYAGGTNPEGMNSTLQESKATGYSNDLPIKSYDFNAPIRENGWINDSFREIRLLSLFLHDFSATITLKVPVFPESNPQNPADTSNLRWCYRTDGNAGFVFVNNYVRHQKRQDFHDVQLSVPTENGPINFAPMHVRDGEYAFFPFNLPLGKATLICANVTPLMKLNNSTYVFYGDREPEYRLEGEDENLRLVTISRKEALQAAKITLDQEYLMISEGVMSQEPEGVVLRTVTGESANFKTWPRLKHIPEGYSETVSEDGFGVYSFIEETAPARNCEVDLLVQAEDITKRVTDSETAGILQQENKKTLQALPEAYNKDGSIYKIVLDKQKEEQELLQLTFVGDRMEIWADNSMVEDAFYTGQTVEINRDLLSGALELIVKVYALHKGDPVYLETWPKLGDTGTASIEKAEILTISRYHIG